MKETITSAATAVRRDSGTEGPPRILVVDEQPLDRDLTARFLRAEGFLTLAAADAASALELLNSEKVDLILLDAAVQNGAGFQLCERIKADRSMGATPVIFLSALDDASDRLRGLRSGGVDYIAKPFHPEEVLARVRIHLRLERAIRCMARQQELGLAELRNAQRAILVTPEELPEASFAVCYRPLDAVGGDLYDVLQLADGLFGYLVGDISGHGVGPSFLISAVKALLRQYSGPLFSAEDTMRGINTVMKSIVNDGQYLTACYARYSRANRLISVVSAGHPAPIYAPAAGDVSAYPAASEPLGLFESVAFTRHDIPVRAGDRLYLYTDGLIEDPRLPAGGRNAGLERVCRACGERRTLPLAEAVEAIVDETRTTDRDASDDLLLLGMEVRV